VAEEAAISRLGTAYRMEKVKADGGAGKARTSSMSAPISGALAEAVVAEEEATSRPASATLRQ
jgi:hypothetical protein